MPDRAAAPGLRSQPFDGVVPVARLGLAVLVERDPARRARPADVDPAQRVATLGEVRAPGGVRVAPPVVLAVRDHLEDGREPAFRLVRVRDRQPQVGGQLDAVAGRDRAPPTWSRRHGAAGSPAGWRRPGRQDRQDPWDREGRQGSSGPESRRATATRTWSPAACDDAAMDDGPSSDGAVQTGPWTRRSRRVAYENAMDHDLARRGDPPGRPARHLRRGPLRQPRRRRPGPRCGRPGVAGRSASLRPRSLLVGDPGGRSAAR